jgi:hypothetical protein
MGKLGWRAGLENTKMEVQESAVSNRLSQIEDSQLKIDKSPLAR